MGNSGSIRPRLEGKPVIVIVGGGYAGNKLARALDSVMNVLVIERKEYTFNNIAAPRACVDDNHVNGIAIPYTNLLKNGFVIQAEVEAATAAGVKLRNRDELIRFDYLVFATGTSYAFPAKVHFTRVQEMRQSYAKVNAAIAKANNIVIVGGGPVGCELAGEISDHHKGSKSITLIHPHEWLGNSTLPTKMHNSIKSRLSALPGVKLLLGERVIVTEQMRAKSNGGVNYIENEEIVTSKQTRINADLVFFCNGAKVNCGAYEKDFAASMDENKRLKVDEHFRILAAPQGFKGNVFAIGDCSAVPEMKLAWYGKMQADYLAQFLKAGGTGSGYTPHGPVMILTLGRSEGTSLFPGNVVVGRRITQMAKGDMLMSTSWAENNLPVPTVVPSSYLKHATPADVKFISTKAGIPEKTVEELLASPLNLVDAHHGDDRV